MDCGRLPQLDHGTVRLEDNRTSHGAKAVYTCHENYTLIGREERFCLDDALWSDSSPQCLFDWCPNPPAIPGGIVNVTGRRAGDTATYTCQAGYILFGQGVSMPNWVNGLKINSFLKFRFYLADWGVNGRGNPHLVSSSTVVLLLISIMENTS